MLNKTGKSFFYILPHHPLSLSLNLLYTPNIMALCKQIKDGYNIFYLYLTVIYLHFRKNLNIGEGKKLLIIILEGVLYQVVKKLNFFLRHTFKKPSQI